MMPLNKWSAAAALWFAAGIYALFFHRSSGSLPFPHFDKWVHFLLFFAQMWLLCKAWLHHRRRIPVLMLVFFGGLYAMATEIIQHFLPGRDGDVWDCVADMAGVCAALYCANGVQAARNRTG